MLVDLHLDRIGHRIAEPGADVPESEAIEILKRIENPDAKVVALAQHTRLDEPEPGLKGKAEIEIMQDLMVAALS